MRMEPHLRRRPWLPDIHSLSRAGDIQELHGRLTRGDEAILRFVAAAETLEADFWQQYNDLADIQDSKVPAAARRAIRQPRDVDLGWTPAILRWLVDVTIAVVSRSAIRAGHRRDHGRQSQYGPPCC